MSNNNINRYQSRVEKLKLNRSEKHTVYDIDIDETVVDETNVRYPILDKINITEGEIERTKKDGIDSPLIVRWRPSYGKWGIVAGARRRMMAILADLQTVPCIIRDLTDDDARRLSWRENEDRVEIPKWLSIKSIGKAVQREIDNSVAFKKAIENVALNYRIGSQLTVYKYYNIGVLLPEDIFSLIKDPEERSPEEKSIIGTYTHFDYEKIHLKLDVADAIAYKLVGKIDDDKLFEISIKLSKYKKDDSIEIVNYLSKHPNKSVEEAREFIVGKSTKIKQVTINLVDEKINQLLKEQCMGQDIKLSDLCYRYVKECAKKYAKKVELSFMNSN